MLIDQSFFQMKPVFDMKADWFATVVFPGKCIAIDESLIAWRGNISFRQYIPSKHTKFGIKGLCNSSDRYISRIKSCNSKHCNEITGWFAGQRPLDVHGQLLQQSNPNEWTRGTEHTYLRYTSPQWTLSATRSTEMYQWGQNKERSVDLFHKLHTLDRLLVWQKPINITTLHSEFNMIDSRKRNRATDIPKMIPRPIGPDYNRFTGV